MTAAVIAGFVFAALLILCAAFFEGTETGFISVDRLEMSHRAQAGDQRASMVEKILSTPRRMIGTTLVGTNLATVAASSIVTFLAESILKLHGAELIGVLFAFSLCFLLFGEIIPKILYRQYANSLAPVSVRFFDMFMRILSPLSSALENISIGLLRLFGFRAEEESALSWTREELLQALKTIHEQGDIDSDEKLMISRTFRFANTSADQVMVPLVDIDALDTGTRISDVLDLIREKGHTRIPVFEEHLHNITGMILAYDLLYKPAEPSDSVTALVRPVDYVPESKKIDELFNEFQAKRTGMAVVVDEYGAAVGIVTPEDILEEIVGEIYDEFDSDVSLCDNKDGSFTCAGKIEVDRFREESGFMLPTGEYETLAGLVLEHSEHIPRPGERFDIHGYEIEVLDADRRRIKRVKISKKRK